MNPGPVRPDPACPESPLSPATDDRNAWDDDYTARGRLWGGSNPALPLLPPGLRVLELGCGDGRSLRTIAGRGWHITGLDYSLPALRLCRDASGRENFNAVAADARVLPFGAGTFDAVFAFHILGHMLAADRERAVAEILRVLSRSGFVYFRSFADGDLRQGTGRELEEGTFVRGTGILTHYFTCSEVARLFSPLVPLSLDTQRWTMRVRGRDLIREEITAVLSKTLRPSPDFEMF